MYHDDFERLRLRAADRDAALSRRGGGQQQGFARVLGRVTTLNPVAGDFIKLQRQAITGAEVEGGLATIADSGGTLIAYPLNKAVPQMGDQLVAHRVPWRWVVEKTVAQPPGNGRCHFCPNENYPSTLHLSDSVSSAFGFSVGGACPAQGSAPYLTWQAGVWANPAQVGGVGSCPFDFLIPNGTTYYFFSDYINCVGPGSGVANGHQDCAVFYTLHCPDINGNWLLEQAILTAPTGAGYPASPSAAQAFSCYFFTVLTATCHFPCGSGPINLVFHFTDPTFAISTVTITA